MRVGHGQLAKKRIAQIVFNLCKNRLAKKRIAQIVFNLCKNRKNLKHLNLSCEALKSSRAHLGQVVFKESLVVNVDEEGHLRVRQTDKQDRGTERRRDGETATGR